MKMMEGVLQEEFLRLKELEKSYAREIKKLPRGSLQEKEIKGHSYVYHVSSSRSVIQSSYLGLPHEEGVKKMKEEIALRKKYESLLKETQNNIHRLEKMLRGGKRSV